MREMYRERDTKGEFSMLVQELRLHDHEYFFLCFRMLPSKLEELLRYIAPDITKCSVLLFQIIMALDLVCC